MNPGPLLVSAALVASLAAGGTVDAASAAGASTCGRTSGATRTLALTDRSPEPGIWIRPSHVLRVTAARTLGYVMTPPRPTTHAQDVRLLSHGHSQGVAFALFCTLRAGKVSFVANTEQSSGGRLDPLDGGYARIAG
jgi:hypothetical protein